MCLGPTDSYKFTWSGTSPSRILDGFISWEIYKRRVFEAVPMAVLVLTPQQLLITLDSKWLSPSASTFIPQVACPLECPDTHLWTLPLAMPLLLEMYYQHWTWSHDTTTDTRRDHITLDPTRHYLGSHSQRLIFLPLPTAKIKTHKMLFSLFLCGGSFLLDYICPEGIAFDYILLWRVS